MLFQHKKLLVQHTSQIMLLLSSMVSSVELGRISEGQRQFPVQGQWIFCSPSGIFLNQMTSLD